MQVKWNLLPVTGDVPTGRQAVSGVLLGNDFVIFGGGPVEGPYHSNIYKLDLTTLVWSEPKYAENSCCPPPRGVMALAGWENKLYMFGGYAERTHLNDFYSFDFATNIWRKIEAPNTPPPRRGASMVQYKEKLYLVGGSVGRGYDASQDIFSFDLKTEQWQHVISTGVPVYRHSAVVYNDKLIIHGGDTPRGFSNKTYVYNFTTQDFIQIDTKGVMPFASEAHCAAIFGDKMVVFGGDTEYRGFVPYVGVLDLTTHFWTTQNIVGGAHPRIFFAADSDGTKLVLFGGRFDNTPANFTYFNDTWTLTL